MAGAYGLSVRHCLLLVWIELEARTVGVVTHTTKMKLFHRHIVWRLLRLVLSKKKKRIQINFLNWIELNLFLSGQKMDDQEGIFNVERGRCDSIQLTKNANNTSFGLDLVEFEELIQLDMACSDWANVLSSFLRKKSQETCGLACYDDYTGAHGRWRYDGDLGIE